ncbi:MAG TPA: helix-turn-helix domain-containing protein [Nitrospinota bacterium]|nr:helix-turn-helix domain-containing protein [Nitrospinota bacterium]
MEIITAQELADYLKLNEVTVYKYAKEGKIPGYKIGKQWRFNKEEINKLLIGGRIKKV